MYSNLVVFVKIYISHILLFFPILIDRCLLSFFLFIFFYVLRIRSQNRGNIFYKKIRNHPPPINFWEKIHIKTHQSAVQNTKHINHKPKTAEQNSQLHPTTQQTNNHISRETETGVDTHTHTHRRLQAGPFFFFFYLFFASEI